MNMRNLSVAGWALVLLWGALAMGQEPLRTVAEASQYTKTARMAEVQEYLDELASRSRRVRLTSIGTSVEGREMPMAIIADPPVSTPEEAAKSGKLVVLLFGGIHPGECDGKEALLALARNLALYQRPREGDPEPGDVWKADALRRLVVLVLPVYNVDGNEKMAPGNRPGQVGPEEMGVRENAQGLDLNRDFVKLEAPETRALVHLMNAEGGWDPAIIVDTHTTNGSFHRYLMTYDGPKNPAGDPTIIEFGRDHMLAELTTAVKERAGFDMFWYGNFEADHTRWDSYPDVPRYGVNYIGMRNRISILTESYSYAGYRERIMGQEVFLTEILAFAAKNAAKIRQLLKAADERAAKWTAGEKVAIASKMVAAPEKATVLGYEEERRDGKLVPTKPRDYQVELFTLYTPEIEVDKPYAYLIPAAETQAVENLRRHGIKVEILREDIELDVEALTIESVGAAKRPFQGHTLVQVEASPRPRIQRVEAGTLVVKTTQPLGALAVYLLEPASADGLTTWNFFDDSLKIDSEFPVLRLPVQRTLLTTTLSPLELTQQQELIPITYEVAFESGRAPNLNGSPIGGLSWLDDGEHYLHVRDGQLKKVHAASGRMEAFLDPAPMRRALARLPTISQRTAGNLTSRPTFRTDKARTGALFEHENDLYYAALDGKTAVRLTSTPQREEFATFSPDGQFVAFVRDNDLFVVDIATQTERALTTGGTDLIRNGKHTWVYFEELYNRNWQAFWWSPDSTRIAYLQEDATPVKTFTLVNDARPGDQHVEVSPYPKPGEPNPRAKLFTVTIAGGEPREVDLSNYTPDDMLIIKIEWWPDSSALACFVSNRVQTWADLLSCPPDGGAPKKLLRESTDAWTSAPDILRFLKDGSIILSSERTGWQHLYQYSREGKLQKTITEGEYEVRRVHRIDEPADWIYFTGTVDSSIAEHLYRVPLEGGTPERLTPDRGHHRVEVAPKGDFFIDSWSSSQHPSQVALRSLEDGSTLRRLDINPVLDLARYRIAPSELVTIPLNDDVELEASITRPPEFDPTLKYPVWLMTYAGPHAPTVWDTWSAGRLWDQALASAGYVVFRVDPRSASGKGAVSAWAAYKQMGVPELRDLEAAVDWLCTRSPVAGWADRARVGIAGHSYGGFMTAFALTHSQVFAAGISGAPVTDWRDYDSIYTERYMLTPQENPEGYDATSAVKAAKNLHGRLLLVHGLMDDNVHAQNSLRLVRALQQANKQFEMMAYPENRHGIGGRHYQRLQWDFIMRTLGGPKRGQSMSGETQLGP
jgi:dipeptidyl-peptidase 4